MNFDGTVTSRWTIGSSSTGRAARNAVLEGDPAGRLERRFRAVHVVVLAEVDLDGHVLNAIARQRAALQQLLAALLDRRHELVRNRAADDGVDEAEVVLRVVVAVIRAQLLELRLVGELCEELLLAVDLARQRVDAQMDLAELAAAAATASCGGAGPRPAS